MKKKVFFLGMMAVGLSLASCKKYQAGCMDPEAENYSSIAKMDDGSCMYQHSSDVTVTNWNYSDPYYYAEITWGNLTQDVIDRGSISVYMVYSNSSIVELPFTASYASTYSSHWYYEAEVGKVTIIRYDSDLIAPNNPGSAIFRLTATWTD